MRTTPQLLLVQIIAGTCSKTRLNLKTSILPSLTHKAKTVNDLSQQLVRFNQHVVEVHGVPEDLEVHAVVGWEGEAPPKTVTLKYGCWIIVPKAS
jgi:hypothetical protein